MARIGLEKIRWTRNNGQAIAEWSNYNNTIDGLLFITGNGYFVN
jgi:hypothetical protein